MRKIPQLLLATGLALAAVLPSLPAQADPPPWAPAHGYRAKQYRYVYYPAYEVYYAPETRLWFWLDGGGGWRFGANLPTGAMVGGAPGVSIVLDTGRPYERHDYVVEQYGRRDRHHEHEHGHGHRGRDD